ncbi:MAG: molybdopterin-dependent oxidoreductase, partial [Raoultibacter sp.]
GVKASTDGALAMSALNEVIEQGWLDTDFVRDHTEAPLLIKVEDGKLLRMSDLGVAAKEGEVDPLTGKPKVIDPYVVWDDEAGKAVALEEAKKPKVESVSEINGIVVETALEIVKKEVAKYPTDVAAKITGVSEEDIKELARMYAQDGPVTTYAMFGDNHYINGHYNYWPIYTLAAFTGNVCKSGAGLGFAELLPTNVGNKGVVVPKGTDGKPCQGAGRTILVNKVAEVLETNMFAGKDMTLKGVYVTNTNPLATMANHEYTAAWFKKIEFVVVADMNMTETAKYADILLPVAHWFEQTDLHVSFGTAPYILWQEKAIEPAFEAKPDFEIYKTLATKLGYGELFNMEAEDYISEWLNSDGAKKLGITFDKLKEEKAARTLPGDNYVTFEDKKFVTPTTRFNLYRDTAAPAYNVGQSIDQSKEHTLYWEPAKYAGQESEARSSYPYHLLSEHMRTRTHTQWWECGHAKEYEPEPIVRINPEDAAALGVKEGDTVKLRNDLGFVVMKAVVNAGLPRGTVSSGRSFQAGEFIDGHFASLPSNEFNQMVANQSFNDVAVAIEKM